MNRVLPTVSISTILLILTLPTVQVIRRCSRFWFCAPEDETFVAHAQWIISVLSALSGLAPQERLMPELAIYAEKVGFLIEKASEFDVKDDVADPDSGSNASDDKMIDVLENHGDDPVVREITGFIGALSQDEQIDLVALMRLGRGDGSLEEWSELRREAAEGANGCTASYLLGEPLLSDFLAEGLDEFGLTWADERTTPVR
jgi:hypothetical protein